MANTVAKNNSLMKRDRALAKSGAPKLGKQKLIRVKKGQRKPSTSWKVTKTG